MHAAGFVLAGGLSTRMGQDKALLPAGSLTFVADVAAKVARAAGSVALVGKPERYSSLGLDCIADLRPDLGPLGGVEAALGSGRGDLNLIVACDMPGLEAGMLRDLLRQAESVTAPCIVTRDRSGAIHPLCAVYRSVCLPVIQQALDARRLRLMDIIDELRAELFNVDGLIWNVNTPQEWSAWRERELSMEGAPDGVSNAN